MPAERDAEPHAGLLAEVIAGGDHSLKQATRNVRHADGRDEHPLQGADERFNGAGGLPWVPEEPAPDDEQKGP
jgi:hypothetical protein